MTWVAVPEGSSFPIENLPYGIFDDGRGARAGVAIGADILDVTAAHRDGLIGALPDGVFDSGTLSAFAALGPEAWTATRRRVTELLTDASAAARVRLVPQRSVTMRLPVAVGDYVDFYSSEHHARNVGEMFRPQQEPLLPNWKHLPVAYHGRASTVVVSGTDIVRPWGQRRGGDGRPEFGPSTRLDFELEVGFVTGPGNVLGEPIPVAEAEQHIFGTCLVNDWSARDIQAWEYVPLGPFLGKSFATTMSPWIVPLAALEPYRTMPPPQDPPALPYLRTEGATGLDLDLEVELNGTVVSRTSFRHMYWSMAQQLAHATVNGAAIRPGDLFASGTVSGPDRGTEGSLLELTRNGTEPLTLPDGSVRAFLEDGDTVVLRARAGDRVGFGACSGTVVAGGRR